MSVTTAVSGFRFVDAMMEIADGSNGSSERWVAMFDETILGCGGQDE